MYSACLFKDDFLKKMIFDSIKIKILKMMQNGI